MRIYKNKETFYNHKYQRDILHDVRYILLNHPEGIIPVNINALFEKKGNTIYAGIKQLINYLKKHRKIHGIRNETFKRLKRYYRQGWHWQVIENCTDPDKIFYRDSGVRLDQFILIKEITNIRKFKNRTYSIRIKLD